MWLTRQGPQCGGADVRFVAFTIHCRDPDRFRTPQRIEAVQLDTRLLGFDMILTTDTDASPNKTTMAAANIATMTRTYVFIITRNQKNSPVFSCTMCSGTMPEITFAGNESVSYVRLAMRPWSNGTIRNSVPQAPTGNRPTSRPQRSSLRRY